MTTAPFDTDRLKAENVSKLDEQGQQRLLDDIKAEVTRLETKAKATQKEAIRKFRQQIARHEAQASWFSGEIKRVEDQLASRSPDDDTPEQKKARASQPTPAGPQAHGSSPPAS